MKGKVKMDKIKFLKQQVVMSVDDIQYINSLIEKDTPMEGLLDKGGDKEWNSCPKCGMPFHRDYATYCKMCGQRLKFKVTDDDVIPFEEM